MTLPAQAKSAMRTRAQEKASQRYQDAKARQACEEAVWARCGHGNYGKCEGCGAVVMRTSALWSTLGHVHEVRLRSRGGSPFDPDNCRLLCADKCHPEAHGLRVGAHRRSERASA